MQTDEKKKTFNIGTAVLLVVAGLAIGYAVVSGISTFSGASPAPGSEAAAAPVTSDQPASCPTTSVSEALGVEILAGYGATKAGGPGVDVLRVYPLGIGAKAGLQKGDVITSVNGNAVDCPKTLMNVFGSLNLTKEIAFAIDRDGKPVTIKFPPNSLQVKAIS